MFVTHLVIALTIRAVHPMRAILALRGGRNRWLSRGVTLAAACKFVVGILVMEFTTSGAHQSFLCAVFVRMAPLPALSAEWGAYGLACQADGDHLTGEMKAAPIKGTCSCSILGVPDFEKGLCHLGGLRDVDKPRPATQGDVFTERTMPKHHLHSF
jgi:hypothetical protein